MTCPIPGCGKRSKSAKGLCSMHSERRRKHGVVGPPGQMLARDGRTQHPLYLIWVRMVRRCTDPGSSGYLYWGGRGISVSPDWLDFPTFAAWIEVHLGSCPAGHSLDRVDNDGNYEPGNVRWASPAQQSQNRRGWEGRDLPKNIYSHHDGYRTILTRDGVRYQSPTRSTIGEALADLDELKGDN